MLEPLSSIRSSVCITTGAPPYACPPLNACCTMSHPRAGPVLDRDLRRRQALLPQWRAARWVVPRDHPAVIVACGRVRVASTAVQSAMGAQLRGASAVLWCCALVHCQRTEHCGAASALGQAGGCSRNLCRSNAGACGGT